MVCLCVHTVVCDPPCVNGACVANDTCNCATGFQGERCTEQGTLVHAAQVIMQRYWLTSPMRGRGSSNHSVCVCVCVCVCYRSSERYECFKSQSKVPTESARRREQN